MPEHKTNPADILAHIMDYKRQEIETAKAAQPYAQIEAAASSPNCPPIRSFGDALAAKQQAGGVALIAEIKKASPSKGIIREDFDPAAIAKAYEAGGASCLSVLTDTPSFQGAPEYLMAVRAASSLPIIRKDFILDAYQIAQARIWGADAILLILACLDDAQLKELTQAAQALDMDILYEVHNEEDLARLLPLAPRLIGVNNRNLHSFETTLETTLSLLPHIPPEILCISESGIASPEHIRTLDKAGVCAYLVGESLMRQDDICAATRNLALALSGE